MTDRYDIVVVGAGVAGAVAARELAPDHHTLLLDRSGIAAEATGRSAGLIAPTLFFGDRPSIAHYTNEFFRSLDGTAQFRLTERNRLDLIPKNGIDEAKATVRQRQDAGFPVDFLDRHAVAEHYPRFRLEEFAGAIEYRDTGWVDPYAFTLALLDDAKRHSTAVDTDAEVRDLLVEEGSVRGVETTSGIVSADTVIVAAGWRTRNLLNDYLELPVKPYRTQCVVLEPNKPLEDDFPLARIGDKHLYLRPEHNGDLLVGGGRSLLKHPETAKQNEDETFRQTVASVVPDLISGFERAGIVNGWAGIDGATPDAMPIIDAPAEGPDGLIVATGFNGLGVMLSPVVGPRVRELLDHETAPFDPAPFRLDRFADRSQAFSLQSTSKV